MSIDEGGRGAQPLRAWPAVHAGNQIPVLNRRIADRETGWTSRPGRNHSHFATRQPLSFLREASGDVALVRRLARRVELTGHKGQVSSLAWNGPGSLLASGSDDCRIKIWDASRAHHLRTVESGHTQTIYDLSFLPDTNDQHLITCAGDRQVRLIDLNKQAVRPFNCHSGRVRAVAPLSSYVFMSASEDGTICQYDSRQRTVCRVTGGHSSLHCTNFLLDEKEGSGRARLHSGINCLALDPIRPHLFATGGYDPIVRLYDRRMLGQTTGSSRPLRPRWVSCYIPPHFHRPGSAPYCTPSSRSHHITGLAFNYNGSELVASYSGEHIYAFGVEEHGLNLQSLQQGSRPDGPSRQLRWYTGLRGRPATNNPSEADFSREIRRSEDLPYASRGAASGSAPEQPAEPSGQPSSRAARASKRSRAQQGSTEGATGSAADGASRSRDTGAESHGRGPASSEGRERRPVDILRRLSSQLRSAVESSQLHRAQSRNQRQQQGTQQQQQQQNMLPVMLPISIGLRERGSGGQGAGELQIGLFAAQMPPLPGADRETAGHGSVASQRPQASAQPSAGLGPTLPPRPNSRGAQGQTSQASAPASVKRTLRGGESDHAEDDRERKRHRGESSRGGSNINDQQAGRQAGPSQRQRVTPEPYLPNTQRRIPLGGSGSHAGFAGAAGVPSRAPAAGASAVGAVIEDEPQTQVPPLVQPGFRRCFKGHRNMSTPKNVALIGGRSEFVASGSDDGHIFVWDSQTGEVVTLLQQESQVINQVAPHPVDPVLASCSTEETVQLWSPEAQEAARLDNLSVVLQRNAQELADGERPRHAPPGLMNMLQAIGDLEAPPLGLHSLGGGGGGGGGTRGRGGGGGDGGGGGGPHMRCNIM